MTEETALLDANARLAGISAHFVCFDVTLHIWQGHRVLRDANVVLHNAVVDKTKVTQPRAILLPPEWAEKLTKLKSKKNGLMANYSLPHLAPGLACVLRTKLSEFMRKLEVLHREIVDVRAELIANWDTDIVQWNRARWGAEWYDRTVDGKQVPGISRDLPNPATLQRRMRLSWSSFAITAGTDAVEELSKQELTTLAAETRRMTQERIDQFVEGLVREPRDRLREALTTVQDTIARGGKITERTFNSLRAALGLLRDFQSIPALSDTLLYERMNELLNTVDALPRATNADGEELRSFAIEVGDAVTTGLTSMMSSVVELCNDDTAVHRQMENLATAGRRSLGVGLFNR